MGASGNSTERSLAARSVLAGDVIHCESCFPKHGPGCVATATDESGRAVCLFCEDGVPCPRMKKRSAQEQKRGSTSEEKRVSNQKVDLSDSALKVPSKTNGHAIASTVAAVGATRVCKVSECATTLGAKNRSGFCHKHFHRSETKTRARADRGRSGDICPIPDELRTSSRSTARLKGNVAVAAKNSLHDHTSEARLNSIIMAWPVEQKLKIVNAWLTGAI